MGGDNDGALHIPEDVRHVLAVEGDAGVGFIGDDVYLSVIALLRPRHHLAQGLQALFRVDDPGGVVGGADDDGPGLFVYGRLNGRDIQLEGLPVGPDLLRHPAMVVDVELVLHEIGGEDDYLFARVEYCLEHHVQCPSRAAGHDHVLGAHGEAGRFGDHFGHGRAGLRVSGVVHVSVHAWNGIGGQLRELLPELGRWLRVGVAEGEVEDVFGPVDLAQAFSFLKHFPDPG